MTSMNNFIGICTIRLLAVCILVVVLVSPVTAGAATWHVDGTNGSDANNGLSAASAFQTISKALDRYGPLAAGDEILIHAGVYPRFTVDGASGTAAAPITIRSFGDGPVVIDAGLTHNGWTQVSTNVYRTVASGNVRAVVVDRVPLFPEFSVTALKDRTFHFDAATHVLHVWVPGGGSPVGRDIGLVSEDEYQNAIRINAIDYIVLSGLTVRHAGGHGIQILGNHVTVRDSAIDFHGKAGISVFTTADVPSDQTRIVNNTLYHNALRNWPRGRYKWCCWPGAIVSNSSSNIEVIGNRIHRTGGEGITLYGGTGGTIVRGNVVYDNYSVNIYVDNRPDNLIEDNKIYCSPPNMGDMYNNGDPDPTDGNVAKRLRPEGIMLADEDYGKGANLNNTRVINNLIFRCRRGFTYYGEAPGFGLKNLLLAHNTIVVAEAPQFNGAPLFGIRIPANNGNNVNVVVRNNVVFSSHPDNYLIHADPDSGALFDNNLYYAPNRASPFEFGTAARTYAQWQGDVSGELHSRMADPAFLSLDVNSTDFLRVPVTSPAVDLADPLVAPLIGVSRDVEGRSRPQGPRPDSGAYEFELPPVAPSGVRATVQ